MLYPAVYSSSSYGQKDLPKIFEYSLSKATKFYKEYNNDKDKIPNVRLNMVNNILCSAYVDDIGIHEMRNSLFTYFITAYDNPGNILKTIFPLSKIQKVLPQQKNSLEPHQDCGLYNLMNS